MACKRFCFILDKQIHKNKVLTKPSFPKIHSEEQRLHCYVLNWPIDMNHLREFNILCKTIPITCLHFTETRKNKMKTITLAKTSATHFHIGRLGIIKLRQRRKSGNPLKWLWIAWVSKITKHMSTSTLQWRAIISLPLLNKHKFYHCFSSSKPWKSTRKLVIWKTCVSTLWWVERQHNVWDRNI